MKNLSELKTDLSEGTDSSEKLVEQALDQAEATSGIYISLFREKALERACQLDKKRSEGTNNGLLDGVPVAIKDNICAKGCRTTCGSKILENFVSPYDATVTKRLESAGAVIIGKTNMDEFAMGSTTETSFFGSTKNPQANDRVPGGSSGGSAAAVAAETVPIALGSDTGGSIRQPAACCGIVGMKPTYGRVSRYGLVAYASSLDQVGPLAGNVEDTALLLNVIAGHDEHDCTSSLLPNEDFTADLQKSVKGIRIGIPDEYFGEGLNDDCKQALQGSLDQLVTEGAELVPVSLPSLEYAISTYYILATAEASSNLSRFDGVRYTHRSPNATSLAEVYQKSRSEGFGDEVQQRILLGTFVLSSGYYDAFYLQAQKVRRVITDDFHKAFESCDILAAPTLPGLPLKLGKGLEDPLAMYLSDIYTVSLNLAGLPGISLPAARVQNMKIGLQLFGKAFAERNVFRVAATVERNAKLL